MSRTVKETPVNCRWCGEEGYQSEWRWTKWGGHGFCSKSCQDQAKEQYDIGNRDWWKEYHPKDELPPDPIYGEMGYFDEINNSSEEKTTQDNGGVRSK